MSTGRPFRFLARTLGGWIVVRIMLLWPQAGPVKNLMRELSPIGLAEADPATHVVLPQAGPVRPSVPVARAVTPSPSLAIARDPAVSSPPLALAADRRPVSDIPVSVLPQPLGPVTIPAVERSATALRWGGGGWAILRGNGPGGGLNTSQLGGAQAGVRLTYALGGSRRMALSARLATPLEGRGREAAFGIDWRPTRLPVRIVAEQRIALDGGRSGPMIGLVGGIDPTPIAAGFRLEGYAQAGAIARDGVEGFADGAMRLAHPVAGRGRLRVDLGIGAWGGAQRGASRLDIGPSLGVAVPVARHTLRLTLDWRERVAGGARPGSGPALSLGTDF